MLTRPTPAAVAGRFGRSSEAFARAARTPETYLAELARDLARAAACPPANGPLAEFDWALVEEDVLGALYQDLVVPADRSGLGAFYTPDWLAALILEEIGYDGRTLLDPACGSGTFLFHAVRRMRRRGIAGTALVRWAAESLAGLDVNPLAVAMARANVMLAVAPELRAANTAMEPRIRQGDALETEGFRADFVVGNPPWLSYRDLAGAHARVRFKELAARYGLLEKGGTRLIPRLDTATLFYEHARRTLLAPEGTIAFVMPKTVVLPSKQHAAFQRRGFSRILDFEGVAGVDARRLFNVPACVAIESGAVTRRVPMTAWSGRPDQLSRKEAVHELRAGGEVRSPYYFARSLQGATIVPRTLWFVEPAAASRLSTAAYAFRATKEARWKVRIEGMVEPRFLFSTALGDDLLPFLIRNLRTCVLPAAVETGRLRMLAENEMAGAAEWVRQVEAIWKARAVDGVMTLTGRLDYQRLLSSQDPAAPHIVLYNRAGANISCAYLPAAERARPFVADTVTHYLCCESEQEAHYLTGVLNSTVVNRAIKPYQTVGLMGARDIYRRPFEVCEIPRFDAANARHCEIATLARRAKAKVAAGKPAGSLAQARRSARELAQEEIAAIDRALSR